MKRTEAIKMLAEHHIEDGDELGEAARLLHTELEPELKLREAIERYTTAVVEDAWKGGGDPEEIPTIEQELKDADDDLDRVIEEVLHREA